MSRYLKAFIAISVLLNLLLAGIIIGDIGHSLFNQNKHIMVHDLAMELPADKREQFKNTILRDDQDVSALWQQFNDTRKKAASVLKAEPFDKAAYLTQIEKLHQLKDQIRQRLADAVVVFAAQANPQERAAMADMLFH